jgi:hypothetical protein
MYVTAPCHYVHRAFLTKGFSRDTTPTWGFFPQVLEELATQPGFRYELGQFEQIKQIGSGAFGRVLLCKHKLTGQKVVLKAIEKKHVIRTRQQHHLQVRMCCCLLAAAGSPFFCFCLFVCQRIASLGKYH